MDRGLVVVAVFVLLLGACEVEDREPESAPAVERAEEEDYQSDLACDTFRGAAYDVTQGLTTDAEFREEIKKVNDFAAIAHPDVQDASEGMLAALTQGDSDTFDAEVRRMGDACRAEGL